VALHLAFQHLQRIRIVPAVPIADHVAAISCGIYKGDAVLDLDYAEDSNADADANFVLTGAGGIVEVQATAEKSAFGQEHFDRMLALARIGIAQLVDAQRAAIAKGP
jgi:ribonuclease PH